MQKGSGISIRTLCNPGPIGGEWKRELIGGDDWISPVAKPISSRQRGIPETTGPKGPWKKQVVVASYSIPAKNYVALRGVSIRLMEQFSMILFMQRYPNAIHERTTVQWTARADTEGRE